MKRLTALLLLLCMLLPGYTAVAEDALPEQLVMTPGESKTFVLPFNGYWESDAPEIAMGEGNVITAYEAGCAMLALVSPEGEEWLVEIEVSDDPVPPIIRDAINIAIAEWEEVGEKRLPQDPKGNKYTKWWKYACGWCGAFVSYCLDQAGVPLEPTDTYRKVKPHEGGIPYSLREAAVPKLYTGFENMERLTKIPQPGYLIIFGAKGYYAYVHVGMVTDVIDLGDGMYQVYTVEGNIGGSTVKRFCFLYNANAEKLEQNMSYLPESEWSDPDTYYYEGPRQTKSDGKKYNWYVTTFCQTWY